MTHENEKAGDPSRSAPANDQHKERTAFTPIEQVLFALGAVLIVAAIIGGVL